MTITTEEAERLAVRLETKSWRHGYPNDFYPEPSGGVFINGVFRGNTAAALRSLAAERDALNVENARLRETLLLARIAVSHASELSDRILYTQDLTKIDAALGETQ